MALLFEASAPPAPRARLHGGLSRVHLLALLACMVAPLLALALMARPLSATAAESAPDAVDEETLLDTVSTPTGASAPCTVLVVQSYSEDYPWAQEIRQGIDQVLGGRCHVEYTYLNTKFDLPGGQAKAREAYELFINLAPDGVIAVDDNAQPMFVLPYLYDSDMPVVFCGVNAEAAEYGYPTDHITGILERLHIAESIALAQQLDPAIRTVSFMLKESPSGRAIVAQILRDAPQFSAQPLDIRLVTSLEQALSEARALRRESDLLFIESLEGLPDEHGQPLSDKQLMPMVAEAFGGPTIGSNDSRVRFGLLCAVVKSGQEQGRRAGQMLLRMLGGTPARDLPVLRNHYGMRIINVETMQALGIRPRPIVLRGAELVRTSD